MAHGRETHEEVAESPAESVEQSSPATEEGEVTASSNPLSEFPTLHPLVVHFPIVLLLLAPMFELGGLLMRKRDLRTVATLLAVGGLAGAFVAANVVHPHTTGLSSEAQQALAAHERYAVLAQWMALLAVLAKLAGRLRRFRIPALDIVGVLLLALAAGAVSAAGHYGGELTHLHGVGPRGAYLEPH
jgi:uncharacterized membrane protein